jgi:hypothetical protein
MLAPHVEDDRIVSRRACPNRSKLEVRCGCTEQLGSEMWMHRTARGSGRILKLDHFRRDLQPVGRIKTAQAGVIEW